MIPLTLCCERMIRTIWACFDCVGVARRGVRSNTRQGSPLSPPAPAGVRWDLIKVAYLHWLFGRWQSSAGLSEESAVVRCMRIEIQQGGRGLQSKLAPAILSSSTKLCTPGNVPTRAGRRRGEGGHGVEPVRGRGMGAGGAGPSIGPGRRGTADHGRRVGEESTGFFALSFNGTHFKGHSPLLKDRFFYP